MARSTQEKEERKLTLPVGHPLAGYTEPDLSFTEGIGTLPDEVQEWNDRRDDAQKDAADAVAEAEDKVARDALKEAEKAEKDAAKADAKAETASSGAKS